MPPPTPPIPPSLSSPPPLTGIRVLDLSRLLPGPYATMLLADMGAEIIKIETPRLGDYARSVPDEFGGPGMFHLLNRNKKSLGLNYRNQRGREILHALAAEADVLVESFRPGAMARWGFDYETLRAANPRLVYCSLSGYGQDGPYKNRAGHDLNYIAIAGLLGLTGNAGGGPVLPGVQVADLSGGMLVALAVVSALFGRERTGQGTYLDVSMMDAVVSWMLPFAGGWRFATGAAPQRGQMPLSGGWPCYNVYQTADSKHLAVGALEPSFWGAFCKAVARPAWLTRAFDPALIPEVAARMREKTRAAWLVVFEGVDACVEQVNSFEEMLHDPQVQHRGLVDVGDRDAAGYPRTGSPLPFQTPAPGSPAPALGQDSAEILRSVGLSAAEIENLCTRGVVKIGNRESRIEERESKSENL